jgi:hypothetical protein
MGVKRLLAAVLQKPLEVFGLQLVPNWRVQWWTAAVRFEFAGRTYGCFYHTYNCGWPPYVSERCVELALADAWLAGVPSADVVEVGAVTPYYWPGRVGSILDPFDPHRQVTHRQSLFDADLTGKRVLSISTFEHIGTGDYGIQEGPEHGVAAFQKVFEECPQFLITVPSGYNRRVDDFLFSGGGVPADVHVGYLVREGLDHWRQEGEPARARLPYGDPALQKRFAGTAIGQWANAVVVLERGSVLWAEKGARAQSDSTPPAAEVAGRRPPLPV